MAKQRMVQTSLWRKSRKFKQCDPLERLLYLYLLTNEDTELCGAYELDLDEIALHTGIDGRMLPKLFARLKEHRLAAYLDGWVIIVDYKAVSANPKVKKGIDEGMSALPAWVREAMDSLSYPIDSLSYPMTDSDSDNDSDDDSEGDCIAPEDLIVKMPGKVDSAPTIRPADPLKSAFIEAISQLLPTTAWPDIPKQMAALTDMAAMTRETQPSTPIETPEQFAQIVVSTYVAMKRKAKSDYWKTASFEPRAIKQRFGEVVTEISRQYSKQQKEVQYGSDPF